jgi:hypothetical protein
MLLGMQAFGPIFLVCRLQTSKINEKGGMQASATPLMYNLK